MKNRDMQWTSHKSCILYAQNFALKKRYCITWRKLLMKFLIMPFISRDKNQTEKQTEKRYIMLVFFLIPKKKHSKFY